MIRTIVPQQILDRLKLANTKPCLHVSEIVRAVVDKYLGELWG